MEHVELYKGHRLNAWTEKRNGSWGAFFTIDDQTLVAWAADAQPSEEAMLREAIAEARRRIDVWPTG